MRKLPILLLTLLGISPIAGMADVSETKFQIPVKFINYSEEPMVVYEERNNAYVVNNYQGEKYGPDVGSGTRIRNIKRYDLDGALGEGANAYIAACYAYGQGYILNQPTVAHAYYYDTKLEIPDPLITVHYTIHKENGGWDQPYLTTCAFDDGKNELNQNIFSGTGSITVVISNSKTTPTCSLIRNRTVPRFILDWMFYDPSGWA